MNDLAPIDPRPALIAGGKVQAIVPHSMDEAYRLAKAVCMAGMAPRGLDTPEKAMVAIMHGMEIGLTPMTALQRIAVVNGRPTIWGDGAMSLVRGSGACEWIKETISGEGDKRTARCEAKRRGDPVPIVRSFSVADARKAGLWGKQGPWQQFPDRMLQMRARAFCLRDGFADVLGGLYLKEELDDVGAADAAPRAAKTPPAPPQIAPPTQPALEAPREPEKPAPRMPPNPHATNPTPARKAIGDTVIAEFEAALHECRDVDGCNEAYDTFVTPVSDKLSETEHNEIDALLRERVAQLEPIEP